MVTKCVRSTHSQQKRTHPGKPISTPNIRLACISDSDNISSLCSTIYGPQYPFPQLLSPTTVKEEISMDHIRFFVGSSTNINEGCIDALFGVRVNIGSQEDGIAELFGLMTKPNLQQNGIGNKLFEAMSHHIESSNNIKFTLCNSRASQFHVLRLCAKFGFLPVGIEPSVYTWRPGTPIFMNSIVPHEHMMYMCKLSDDALHLRRISITNDFKLPPLVHRLASLVLRMFKIPLPSKIDCSISEVASNRSLSCYLTTSDINSPDDLLQPSVSLPLSTYESMLHDASVHDNACLKKMNYRCVDQSSYIGSISCIWDDAHANMFVDSVQFKDNTSSYNNESYQLEILRSMSSAIAEHGMKLKSKLDDGVITPLSIVFFVSADQTQIVTALEQIGYIPVAYYPGFLSKNGERVDVIRYLLMPELKTNQSNISSVISSFYLPQNKILSTTTDSWMYAIYRTIKSSLLQCSGQIKESKMVPFLGYPKPNTIAVWPWSQLGWEEELEASWKDILNEFQAVKQQSLPVQVWGKEINPEMSWRKLVFTFTGVDLLPAHNACPFTSSILKKIPNLIGAEFSLLPPGKLIAEHNNCVFPEMIRSHLGLIIPEGDVQMHIGGELVHWHEGSVVTFDDTFSHSVWNRTDKERLVLIIDVKRPTEDRDVVQVNRDQWIKWYSLLRRSSTGSNIEFDTDTNGIMSLRHGFQPYDTFKKADKNFHEVFPGIPEDVFWYVLNCFYPQLQKPLETRPRLE